MRSITPRSIVLTVVVSVAGLAAACTDAPTTSPPPSRSTNDAPPSPERVASGDTAKAAPSLPLPGTTEPGHPGPEGSVYCRPLGDSGNAPVDTGTVCGHVYGANWTPVAGATVEIGRWTSTPYAFRDTAAGSAQVPLDDPRVVEVVRTVTDAAGRYAFPGRSGTTIYALRALPPAGSPLIGGYFPAVFHLFTSRTIKIDVHLRSH